jgi:hypothetical protein
MGRGKHAEGTCLGRGRSRGTGGLCAPGTVPPTPLIQMGKRGPDADCFLSAESVYLLDTKKPRQFTPGPLVYVKTSVFSLKEKV